MSWMVAVLVVGVALEAQIEILARCARDKLSLRKDDDAAIASAGWNLRLGKSLGLIGEGTWNALLDVRVGNLHRLLSAWRDALRRAVDHFAVLNEALDEPMAFTRTQLPAGNAALAQVVVSTIADTAMEMGVCHRCITLVAVHGPWVAVAVGSGYWLAKTEGKRALRALLSELVKEALLDVFSVEWLWHGSFGCIYKCLLGVASLTELEDTAADRAAIESSGVTWTILVHWRTNDDRLHRLMRGLLLGHVGLFTQLLLWQWGDGSF